LFARERAVGDERAARGREYARQQSGLAHRDGDHFAPRQPRRVEQSENGETVRDVARARGELEDARGRSQHAHEDGFEVGWKSVEVVMRADDFVPVNQLRGAACFLSREKFGEVEFEVGVVCALLAGGKILGQKTDATRHVRCLMAALFGGAEGENEGTRAFVKKRGQFRLRRPLKLRVVSETIETQLDHVAGFGGARDCFAQLTGASDADGNADAGVSGGSHRDGFGRCDSGGLNVASVRGLRPRLRARSREEDIY
jgi:hypothetical protein